MITRRQHFLLRCLTGRAGLMALAVFAAMAWNQTVGAAPLRDDGAAVVLPLAEMAIPQTPHLPYEVARDAESTVLRPSCSALEPGACARLAEICDRLDGAMEAGDSGETCVILLD